MVRWSAFQKLHQGMYKLHGWCSTIVTALWIRLLVLLVMGRYQKLHKYYSN